eukprot:CAMPEP_0204272456 /NCGR_PEP_ID=MMETSP0468-20130131/22095_1 /ASSEMBLY_ACC=CAM_ASM_000383 /TAXON_ID=2969 /ORGANISM="Oxyrrhis marina" /LENGTH=305 /DNA_ID=CAMNT_0051248301 /DNA_START=29 /DNA_END=946 /DNA_ORIENTATION=-
MANGATPVVSEAKRRALAARQSSGFIPAVNKELVTPQQLRRLQWGTTSRDELADKGPSYTENLGEIHFIGQRDTKYGQFTVSRSPFWGKEMTKYNMEFHELPLGSAAMNNDLADIFRRPSAPVGAGPQSVKAVSGYQAEFQAFPGFRPVQTLKPSDDRGDLGSALIETKSRSHEEFPAHRAVAKRSRAIDPHAPPLAAPMRGQKLMSSTSYGSSFSAAQERMRPSNRGCVYPSDESNRVIGSNIPNQYQQLIFSRKAFSSADLQAMPRLESVLFGKSGKIASGSDAGARAASGRSLSLASRGGGA